MTMVLDRSVETAIARLLQIGGRGPDPMETARRISDVYPTLRALSQASVHDLCMIEGMTKKKAEQLLAAFTIGIRYVEEPKASMPTIRSPQDAYELLRDELRLLNQEHFVCLYLNTKNQLIARKTLFVGGLNSSIVHPRDVFREALKLSAACFIAVHNHPSGDATPSREDIEVSERLVEAGNIVGIACLDHVIIGEDHYVSMKQRGYMNG
ncbi:DNA repair protein RadC [Exiguobacterium sp. s37]|uniref:RadC family protein n=1 Tax=Exiguobacterium sp. s37 TaxID=2751275 RepID=UPI001BEB26CA|nr:DNA repair protein RadC [Exiguobacterium sp. s37]